MQAPRAATARHGRETVQQECLTLRGEGAGLLVPHVNELDTDWCKIGGKSVQGVPDDAVAMLDAGFLHRLNDDSRYFLTHC
jgi:hypothetical protein